MTRPSGFAPLRQHAAWFLSAAVLFGAPPLLRAASFVPRPVPGRLVLELGDDVPGSPWFAGPAAKSGLPSLDALGERFGVTAVNPLFPGETVASKALAGTDLSRFFVVEFPPTVELATVRAAYAALPAVRSAEFDWMEPVTVDVNDAGSQWHLESWTGKDAHVTGGWNHSRGDSTVLLAIADTGVDWRHPDLGGSPPDYRNGNVWTNWAEVKGVAGVDDDANGYVDDVRGWDFVAGLSGAWPGEDASGADNDPSDFNGHGTHVAGIAGAITDNGVGVAGVGYRCKVMALRIGGSVDDAGMEQGVVLLSAAASAINYARQKGAAAVNCSWGSSFTSALSAAVGAAVAQGMVVVVAAGNDAANVPSYLSSRSDCFDVAASTADDRKAPFSNFGTWVDVVAPGVSIYSTYYNHTQPAAPHTYEFLQGTSMAAPIVTGLVGLVRAQSPGFTGTQIQAVIRQGCDNIDAANPGFAGQLGAGRVNALRLFRDFKLAVPMDYATFEKALAASGPGDTLALRGGDVYDAGMNLWRSGRNILGGWNSTFTSRDPVHNPTIVQRNGIGPAVEVQAGVDATLLVDGVTFTGGVARQLSTPLAGVYGGGLLCIDASPIFRNCRFVGNSAGDAFTFGGGGGGFFANSRAQLIDCTWSGNSAQAGAGIYVYGSSLRIEGGSIHGNSAPDGPGTATGCGIHAESGSLFLSRVAIHDNVGADEGGGIYVHTAAVDGDQVVLANNPAASSGGNVRLAGGSVALRASTVRDGVAQLGGGIYAALGASLSLQATWVAGNRAAFLGGGIYAQGATGSFRNVTWDGNRGTAAGADAIYATACPNAWLVRSCLVTNHASTMNPALLIGGAAPLLDYNTFWNNAGGDLSGGSLGGHDTVQDPLFVNEPTGDLALGLHSPALDSGDPATTENDPDGTRNDRGAFGGPAAVRRAPFPPVLVGVTRVASPQALDVLTWSRGFSTDVQLIAVYRGTSADFLPGPTTFVAAVPVGATPFSDPAGEPASWYRLAAIDSSAASSGFTAALQPSPSTDNPPPAPARFALQPAVPNPFNPTTQLRVDLPAACSIELVIFDARGTRVRLLAAGARGAGSYPVLWDGRDDRGRSVASGVYVAQLVTSAGQHAVRKLALLR